MVRDASAGTKEIERKSRLSEVWVRETASTARGAGRLPQREDRNKAEK